MLRASLALLLLIASAAVFAQNGRGIANGTTGTCQDVADRAVAERFIAGDPYTKAGLFQSVTVTRWRKAFFDGRCLV